MTESKPPTRDAAYFERLYAANPDPWNFAASAYEAQKYVATLAMLGERHFARGLEVGCSIGVSTIACGAVSAIIGGRYCGTGGGPGKARCAGAPHITFECVQVPQNWPVGQFDLVVLSEVLYFLNPVDIARTAALADASLVAGGVILLVNYTEILTNPAAERKRRRFSEALFRPASVV